METERNKTGLPAAVFTEVKLAEIEPSADKTETVAASEIIVEIGELKITTDSSYPTEKLAALCRELAQS